MDSSELCTWAVVGLCRAGVHRSLSGKYAFFAMEVMMASRYSPCRKLTTCSSSRTTSSSRTATSARSSNVWAQFRRRRKSEGNRFETVTNYGLGCSVKLIEKQ